MQFRITGKLRSGVLPPQKKTTKTRSYLWKCPGQYNTEHQPGLPKFPHVGILTRPQSRSRRQSPEKIPAPGQDKVSAGHICTITLSRRNPDITQLNNLSVDQSNGQALTVGQSSWVPDTLSRAEGGLINGSGDVQLYCGRRPRCLHTHPACLSDNCQSYLACKPASRHNMFLSFRFRFLG